MAEVGDIPSVKDEAHHGSLVARSTKCHGDHDIEMYCGSHNMVYCAKCIATEHRSCSGVVGIESVQTSFVQQNEVQRLQDETTNIQERLATADKKKQENLESLEEQRNAILDKIQDTDIPVAGAKKLLEDNEASRDKVLSFTENEQPTNGRSSAPRQYKVKSKKEINIKIESDSEECYITDVCQLQDGTIILTDYFNTKLKRLDVDNNIRDHFNLDAMPTSICDTGQNEVAVKMENNKIQFISIGTTFSILRNISIEGGGYWGMAYGDGNFWVSSKSGVYVYSASGTLLKIIAEEENGQNMFKRHSQHMAVNMDTVIVTDGTDGAISLRRDGTVKQQYRDQRLEYTRGACISNDGTVFLSGYSSCNILMFSLDGKCLGELVSKGDGLTNPVSLCYDNKRNYMFVTCASSDTIRLFMCD